MNTGNAVEKEDIKLNSVWGLGNMPSGEVFRYCFVSAPGVVVVGGEKTLVSKLEETEQIIWIKSD